MAVRNLSYEDVNVYLEAIARMNIFRDRSYQKDFKYIKKRMLLSKIISINQVDNNIITLNDENGNEVEFEFLDLIPYRQNEYVVLLPIGDSDGQVVILQLKEIDDETEEYVGVENEFVLETVFALFKERNKDFFTFE